MRQFKFAYFKRILFPLVCLATALIPVSGAGGASPAARAGGVYGKLKFDSHTHDFGHVYRGVTAKHRFKFTNVGTGLLTIQGVHAACGCTAVEVDKGRKYAPGESGFVEIAFDTTDFAGHVVKTVTVMSNERLLPDRVLTLKANVKSEVEADPPLVDFGDVKAQTGATQSVRVRSLGGHKLVVKELIYNRQILEAGFVRDGEHWTLNVTLLPGLAPGFVKETLIVRNNSSHLPELPIPVRATVKGAIDFSPAYLEFGAIAPSEATRRSITMRGSEGLEVQGARVEMIINGQRIEDSSRFVRIDTMPHEKDKKLVSVELKNASTEAGSLPGSVHGKLYFKTSDPVQPELAVDFYAFFR